MLRNVTKIIAVQGRDQKMTVGVFKQKAYRNQGVPGILIKPGDKVFLAVKASDKYALADEPHTGVGDRYELEVVTPEQLLAMLEVREVGLRRRFELIIDEMTQMRDSLLRVKASLSPGAASGAEPEDLKSDDEPDGQPLTPEQKAQREAELRLLRVQRAMQQSQKSVQEVMGVAAGFLDIREELINNRVDTEDRKNRLKEQIADPLNKSFCQSFLRNRIQLSQKVYHVTEFLVETECIFINVNVVNLNFVI
jgi:hypothetical protein